MKRFLLIAILGLCGLSVYANHLKGGFFTYSYLGPGVSNPNYVRYHVTLTVYMDCAANGQQINSIINFTFFNGTSSTVVANPSVSISQQYDLAKAQDNPCITGNQAICFYKIVVYDLPSIELPANPNGYTVSYQRCCRIGGIINIAGNSSAVGNTYSAFIPGTNTLPGGNNSSVTFQINDTVVICRNNYFQYSFSGKDPDGDSLSYSFCDAWGGASQNDPAPNQATAPPYATVQYSTGFGGTFPLGSGVKINPVTGLISGVAPSSPGEYVVTVCVNEYRNGVLLTTDRKELHFKIGDCEAVIAAPAIFDSKGIRVEPSGAGCRSFTYSFANDAPANPLVKTYYWEVSDGAVYTTANPTHTFADTGVYTIKLVVNREQDCSDSVTTSIKIYPGFFPGFTFTGICAGKPTKFFDTTKTVYGVVNKWSWDFGDGATLADTSSLKNPIYTFQTGTYNVQLTVSNSKGCTDTVTKQVSILTKPPLSLAFKDTLICNGDSVQFHAIGNGNFSWTPVNRIINENTADPTAFPTATTQYFVQLDDQGCLNNDTVQVRVVDAVTLQAMADTIICSGDSLRLHAITNGLKYVWSPANTILEDPTLLRPLARPTDSITVYNIKATIGRCSASANVKVSLVPYPFANAGPDTTICYNTDAFLQGSHNGSSFNWSPTATLTNANTLTPVAHPLNTTAYILTVYDTRGCPKPGRDTVIVNVNPQVIAYAGRDTLVVVGQPLQFNATGGINYSWSPATALNKTNIANPVGVYDGSFDSIRYYVTVSDAIGCTDVATVLVKIFKTNPQVFVPTAFTPNGDGKNDVLRPIAVGLTKLDYFRIYNRWGQLVFETTINGKGWDGRISGQPQGADTYVWIVKGTDFTGKTVFEKGTVTLIR